MSNFAGILNVWIRYAAARSLISSALVVIEVTMDLIYILQMIIWRTKVDIEELFKPTFSTVSLNKSKSF